MRNRMLLPAVSGMLLGYLVITIVVAAGVGATVLSVPLFLTRSSQSTLARVSVLRNRPITSVSIMMRQ